MNPKLKILMTNRSQSAANHLFVANRLCSCFEYRKYQRNINAQILTVQKSPPTMYFYHMMIRFEASRALRQLFLTLPNNRERHIFSENSASAFETQGSSIIYQKPFSKNRLCLEVKLSTESRQLSSGEHFLLKRAIDILHCIHFTYIKRYKSKTEEYQNQYCRLAFCN